MGGNAIKSVPLKRLNRVEYDLLEAQVVQQLTRIGCNVRTIPFYHTKDSFGDMDLVVEKRMHHSEYRELVKDHFQTKEIVVNNDYITFELHQFQVDLLLTPVEEMDAAVTYYAFNDRSNLVGRIAHKLGFKFGHKGVYFIHRDGDRVLAEILVTRDLVEFQESVLGVPYRPETYNTLEDIFENVMQSPYFNPVIYQFDNLNAVARIRDKKRPTYNKFLQYIKGIAGDFRFNPIKAQYYYPILKRYGVLQQVLDATRMADTQRHMKMLVGGDALMQYTNLRGKELGQFKTRLMQRLTEPELMLMSDEDVAAEVFLLENEL